MQVTLTWLDYLILLTYTCFVVGIGFALRKYMRSSSDFLTSGRSIPTWVTGLAFISANLGALELVGMAASGAKYGIITAHFYWVGAIPAMVFLAVFMMPFYYGSRARSVPEYLKMRFDERVRALNSISFAVMTVFASGISMNALAKLLHLLLGWNYHASLWICSAVVLVYVLKGGLTSAIYTEVLQFFMIVLGFAPVVYLGLKDVGGYHAMAGVLSSVATNPSALHLRDPGISYSAGAWTSAWRTLLSGPANNPMGVDWFAMVFGLGFVLSFGYWCTNFLVVQRAMAARNMTAARNTPLVAAVPKMLFPALVILPGMIAVALMAIPSKGYRIPAPILDNAVCARAQAVVASAAQEPAEQAFKEVSAAVGRHMDPAKVAALVADYAAKPMAEAAFNDRLWNAVNEYDYDGVILSLVRRYCPTGLLGLALTGLLASFMSGMAGNVTAFNTVSTYDLYQAYVARNKSDEHYMRVAQVLTLAGILASIACAYVAKLYNNAMDIIQLVFAFVNAPLFATFLLGMFWKRATGTGAFVGLLLGTMASGLVHALTIAQGNVPGVKGGYLAVVHTFPSEMAQNFWLATFAFLVCFVMTAAISLATRRTKPDEELAGLVYSLTPKIRVEGTPWYQRPGVIGTALLGACAVLNLIFW